MGINPKGYLLGGMGGKIWFFFLKHEGGVFKKFPRNYSFGGVGWGVWRKHMGFFFFFFWGDMVTQ
jgi:hypothetical protein